MIVFEKIRYKNFLSTGNAFTEVNLVRPNNTLIVGKNGAGKCVRHSTKIDIDFLDEETREKFLDWKKNRK